jgi:hypothetical protein
MKKITKQLGLLIVIILFTGIASFAQTATTSKPVEMKTYVIERTVPGAGQFTPEKLKAVSQNSCSVLRAMGPDIQWIQSYVTGDKIFCIYKAENEDLLREHAKRAGIPIDAIYQVQTVISPATAN